MDRSDHARLVELLARQSARRGQFTLASGRQSTLYIDARLTTMSPEGLILIGNLGLGAVRSTWMVDAIGGLTLGADPISYAIAFASAVEGKHLLRAFTVRKEAKQHGTGKLIEGPFRAGDRVAIVEDVITTGGSALRAATAVQESGGAVQGILALVDRQEGGREILEKAGFPVLSLVTAAELIPHIPTAE